MMGLQELLVLLEMMGLRDQLEPRVLLVLLERQGQLVLLELMALLEPQVLLDYLEAQEQLESVLLELLEALVLQVQQALEQQEQLALLVLAVLLDTTDRISVMSIKPLPRLIPHMQ
jgi:hypothetical protein